MTSHCLWTKSQNIYFVRFFFLDLTQVTFVRNRQIYYFHCFLFPSQCTILHEQWTIDHGSQKKFTGFIGEGGRRKIRYIIGKTLSSINWIDPFMCNEMCNRGIYFHRNFLSFNKISMDMRLQVNVHNTHIVGRPLSSLQFILKLIQFYFSLTSMSGCDFFSAKFIILILNLPLIFSAVFTNFSTLWFFSSSENCLNPIRLAVNNESITQNYLCICVFMALTRNATACTVLCCWRIYPVFIWKYTIDEFSDNFENGLFTNDHKSIDSIWFNFFFLFNFQWIRRISRFLVVVLLLLLLLQLKIMHSVDWRYISL